MDETTKIHLQNSKNYIKRLEKEVKELCELAYFDKKLRIKAEQRENLLRAYKSEIEGSKQDGIEEGKQSEKIEIAKKLLKMNLPLEQISTVTGLTIEEIKKLR